MTVYVTQEGDELDYLCWRHYGRASGTVELVLEANRSLAGMGPKLPAGLEIELPEAPPVDRRRTLRLWD